MPHRILLVRFSALGDVLLTTPLVRALATAWPDARITYVTKAAAAPVFARSPRVAEVVALDPGGSVRGLARRLAGAPWDLCVDLHASLRARLLRMLVPGPWRAVRPRRWDRRLCIAFGADRLRDAPPVAERYFAAVSDLGVRPDGEPAEMFTSPEEDARAAALAPGGHVVVAPGAAHATKRWPPSHWRALAARLRAEGLTVVGVGTAGERERLEDAHAVPAFGEGLGVTAALLRHAACAVTHDSGLMHLASAMGAPVVALFGPTTPAFGYAPYRATGVLLHRTLPCRPCAPYGGPRCPLGHHRCMIDIDPATVAEAVVRRVQADAA